MKNYFYKPPRRLKDGTVIYNEPGLLTTCWRCGCTYLPPKSKILDDGLIINPHVIKEPYTLCPICGATNRAYKLKMTFIEKIKFLFSRK